MYILNCSLLLYVLAWTFRVSSSPTPFDLSIPADLSAVTNLTFGPIPSNFKIRSDIVFPYHFTEDAISINVIQALKEIAKGDFKGLMPTRNFRTAQYPQPVLSVRAPLALTIKREYVVWGMLLALHAIYFDQGLHWTHFTLLWDNEEVGGLGVGNPRGILEGLKNAKSKPKTSTVYGMVNGAITKSQVPSGSSSISTSGAAVPIIRPAEASNLTIPSNNNRLKVDFTYTARNIHKRDMFTGIVWAMAVAAIPNSEAILPDNWSPGNTDSPCKFFAQVAPRTAPPFFHFFWLIDALADTADYLVAKNTYQSLNMLIKVDDIPVGSGVLIQGPNTIVKPGGGTLGATA